MRGRRVWGRFMSGVRLSVLAGVWVFGASGLPGPHLPLQGLAHAAALTIPEVAPMERFDFEQQGLEGWKPVDGRWGVEAMSGAPSGQRVLGVRAGGNARSE